MATLDLTGNTIKCDGVIAADVDATAALVAAAAAVTNITVVATTGTLPTANGDITIADAATPTVAELQEFCVELNAKINALKTALGA